MSGTQPKPPFAGSPANPANAAPNLGPNLVGQVIDGRYAFMSVLGAGGMGTVYRARHVALERDVAIKVLQSQLAKEETWTRRFMQEARAASRIRHANVVEILDFGTLPDGSAYCVMELLEGLDLSHLLAQHGRLHWNRAQSILLQMVRGLGAAHQRGVIHRDVKPGNCFLLDAGQSRGSAVTAGGPDLVKMLDFGIAKVVGDERGDLTATNEIIGTATYMAPERAARGVTDIRSDIYSVGIVAYRMLTGTVPFRGETSFATLTHHVNTPPPPMRGRDPAISEAVEQVVFKALAKHPDARYQSMAEFEAALTSVDAHGRAVGPYVPVVPIPTGPPLASVYSTQDGSLDGDSNTEVDPRLSVFTESTSVPGGKRGGAGVWIAVVGLLLVIGGGIGAAVVFGLRVDEGSMDGAAAAPIEIAAVEPAQAAGAPEHEPAAGPDPIAATPVVVPEPDPEVVPEPEVVPGPEVVPEPEVEPESQATTDAPRPNRTTRRRKSKSTAAANTDTDVLGGVRRKARKQCRDVASGTTVEVRFSILSSGKASLPRPKPPHEHSPAGKCVVKLVRAATFPAGSMRAASLAVKL